jgi:hypothetical protein
MPPRRSPTASGADSGRAAAIEANLSGPTMDLGPGNVTYLTYWAGYEQTAQPVRRHRPGRQAGRSSVRPGSVRGHRQPGSLGQERQRRQRAHGLGDHLPGQRCRAGPVISSCCRPGRCRRRAQGREPGSFTQPVSGRWPLSCGGSKNTVSRNWSWQLLQATRTCPMPRPRPAASRAGSQMHGFQLTCALPGHSSCPNGQHCGLFSNREADT